MTVYISGYYTVAPKGSPDARYQTTNGDLASFDSAATQAVESSRRESGTTFNVWYHPLIAPDQTYPDRTLIGSAQSGIWSWR